MHRSIDFGQTGRETGGHELILTSYGMFDKPQTMSFS